MGKAIGIDLGTTNSVVAYKDTNVKIIQTGPNNEELCRSCVTLDNNGQFLVGNAVYRNWKRYTPNIVVSVKRLMGAAFNDDQVQKMASDKRSYPFGIKKPSGGTEEAVAVLLQGKEFTPEQISAEILKALKKDAETKLGGEVTHAVITVPAYFTEKQKAATQKAAEIAGIHVQRLLAEPTAAAISYGFDQMKPGESKNILVYDFGGGTFDLSILTAVDGQFIEFGSGGNRWLGGDDIDRELSKYVCSEIEKRDGFKLEKLLKSKSPKDSAAFYAGLKSDVEDAKKTLSQVDRATIYFSNYLEDEDEVPINDLTIERKDFEELIRPIIQQTIQLIGELLEKTNVEEENIDNILLVGGSSCIPLVRKMLGMRYGVDKVISSERPMLAVAEGAAILAQSLPCSEKGVTEGVQDGKEEEQIVITTTKHQTFIGVVDGYSNIIDSQEPLPLETSKKFYTTVNNQKIVVVDIYNDVENGEKKKITTGFFTISDNLPEKSELKFTFNLDENELLSTRVKIVKTGEETDIRLGRGYRDSKCLGELEEKIDLVLHDASIPDPNKVQFIAEIQTIIDDINNHNYSENDTKWDEIEQKVTSAFSRTKMDNSSEVNVIIAIILLKEFGKYINGDDAQKLVEGVNKINNSKNNAEKNSIYKELEEISHRYGLLLDGYCFKMISENSDSSDIAKRASAIYEKFQNALQNHNISEMREIINQNSDFLQEETAKGNVVFAGGTGITQ